MTDELRLTFPHCTDTDSVGSLVTVEYRFRLDTAKLLVRRGASFEVSQPGSEMLTDMMSWARVNVLHTAAAGQLDMVRYLFERDHPLDVNAPDGRGFTALHYALTRGHRDTVVPYLVGLGAGAALDRPCVFDPACDDGSRTLLRDACLRHRFDEAIELLELGTSLSADQRNQQATLLQLVMGTRRSRDALSAVSRPLALLYVYPMGCHERKEELRGRLLRMLLERGPPRPDSTQSSLSSSPP